MKQYEILLELFLSHLNNYRAGLSNKQPVELYEPENYILSLGGKRLRPLLSLIACDLFNADPKKALDTALCVELFHNFSLIHDDILDAAPLRRNKETVHTKWNTNIAILSGDVMLVKAFQVLQTYKGSQFEMLSALFAKTSIEVCEGQQLDMNFEKQEDVTVDDYLNMITNKTAVLLGCSLQMGAIVAGAGKQDQENIYAFGKHVGIAFQLLDDLLDAYANDSVGFGKQIGGDIIAGKKTFLVLKALELAGEKQKEELKNLLLSNKSDPQQKVKAVMAIFNTLNVKELCEAEADLHTQKAIDCLTNLSVDSDKKEKLKHFALELLNRNT